MLDEKHLKLCLTIFNRIHKIQEKGVYSYSEVSNVLKLIENIRNEFGDSDSLDKGIEYYYKNLPNTDIGNVNYNNYIPRGADSVRSSSAHNINLIGDCVLNLWKGLD